MGTSRNMMSSLAESRLVGRERTQDAAGILDTQIVKWLEYCIANFVDQHSDRIEVLAFVGYFLGTFSLAVQPRCDPSNKTKQTNHSLLGFWRLEHCLRTLSDQQSQICIKWKCIIPNPFYLFLATANMILAKYVFTILPDILKKSCSHRLKCFPVTIYNNYVYL